MQKLPLSLIWIDSDTFGHILEWTFATFSLLNCTTFSLIFISSCILIHFRPNLDDIEPKSKNKKSSKESSSTSAGGTSGGTSRQERHAMNKSNGYIPSPSPSLTPMTNKNAPTGHNVDMDRVISQPPQSASCSFAMPPPPTSKVNREALTKE